jgi:predicted porin
VDLGVSYYENKNIAGDKASQWALTGSNLNSSKIGFRGTEDLGGGLAASFWLEAGVSADTGQAGSTILGSSATSAPQLFNRRSTVSLSGRFGEVRLGRDYVPTFWNDTVFDPFGTNGAGSSAINVALGGLGGFGVSGANTGVPGNYVRANNTVGYFLPSNLGGFYGQLMYGLSERPEYDPGTAAQTTSISPFVGGTYAGGRFGYANGPLDVAAAYGQNTFASNYNFGGSGEVNTGNLGAAWDFGFMKLMGEYSQVDVKSDLPNLAVDLTYRGYLIGSTFPVGPGLIKVSYSHVDVSNAFIPANTGTVGDDPSSDKFAIGYVHNLSKRTQLYATAAFLKNKNMNSTLALTNGGPTTGATEKSMGYNFGVSHSF